MVWGWVVFIVIVLRSLVGWDGGDFALCAFGSDGLHEICFSKGAKGYMYSLVGMGWGETLWKVYRYSTLCLFSDVS